MVLRSDALVFSNVAQSVDVVCQIIKVVNKTIHVVWKANIVITIRIVTLHLQLENDVNNNNKSIWFRLA